MSKEFSSPIFGERETCEDVINLFKTLSPVRIPLFQELYIVAAAKFFVPTLFLRPLTYWTEI